MTCSADLFTHLQNFQAAIDISDQLTTLGFDMRSGLQRAFNTIIRGCMYYNENYLHNKSIVPKVFHMRNNYRILRVINSS